MTAEDKDLLAKCSTIMELEGRFSQTPRQTALLQKWKKEIERRPVMIPRDIPKSLHNDGDYVMREGIDY